MATQLRPEAYLTLLELAERYRTTEAVVRYWRHTGYGPQAVKIGKRLLYPVAEVERFEREAMALAASQGQPQAVAR